MDEEAGEQRDEETTQKIGSQGAQMWMVGDSAADLTADHEAGEGAKPPAYANA